jgi:hypothetical protein
MMKMTPWMPGFSAGDESGSVGLIAKTQPKAYGIRHWD